MFPQFSDHFLTLTMVFRMFPLVFLRFPRVFPLFLLSVSSFSILDFAIERPIERNLQTKKNIHETQNLVSYWRRFMKT